MKINFPVINCIVVFAFSIYTTWDSVNSSRSKAIINSPPQSVGAASPNTFDTILLPFRDTSYKLRFYIFDTENGHEDSANSTITFYRSHKGIGRIIFTDSFYCMYNSIEHMDFNNDKIKDLLFFYYTGGRSNPTYHLYLVDTMRHKLTYVKGFEDLPNPFLDSTNNIITSGVLYADRIAYSFYRITNNHLINLGHPIDTDWNDSTEYENAIKQILKEKP